VFRGDPAEVHPVSAPLRLVPRVPSSDPVRRKGSVPSHGVRRRNPWHPPAQDQERPGFVAAVSVCERFPGRYSGRRVRRVVREPLQRIPGTRSGRPPMMKLGFSCMPLFDNSYRSTTCARPRAPFPRTKPIASAARAPRTKPVSPSSNEADNRITKRSQWHDRGGWVKKAGEIPPEPTSQTNPLVRYDVLSSEKHRYSGGWGFPDRSQHVSESNDQVFDRASVPTKRTQIVDAPRAGWVAWERARVFAERHVLESRWFIYRDETG
jgi:hypothetical protein